MNRFPIPAGHVVLALGLAAMLAGCGTTEALFGTKVDYKAGAAKTPPLDVPPDLTQLARESRFQPQGGVISAAAAAAGGPRAAAGGAGAGAAVALTASGDMRVERQGQARWLVVPVPPEQLWPRVRDFWTSRGFTLEVEDPAVGVMETAWTENRSKLPDDIIRNTIGRVFGRFYDTGERDRFRTRIERTASGSEVFISHRGLIEEYTDGQRVSTAWRARPGDPQIEAEFLSRLMIALGAREQVATAAVSGAPAAGAAAAPEAPARARTLAGQPAAALEVDEPFDRAWRRVGLALDRSGFTVEDRDRANGLYYVRYVDPESAGKEEPNWIMKLFGANPNPQAAQRYRIALKAVGEKTTISVLSFAGDPDNGDNARRIAGLLVTELK